jgi:peptidoglycan/LPS O-acetylase OafA/YrhL
MGSGRMGLLDRAGRRRFCRHARRLLLPVDSSVAQIRALDGLRAIAALSVVTFHFYIAGGKEIIPFGTPALNEFYFLASGVQLFFVLSGFLLFLPYARSILSGGTNFPEALRFYARRALRILPAYWVCLGVLVFAAPRSFSGSRFAVDVLAHLGMVHDDFPLFNRDIEGPFWTLAVEVQFYLALPLIAAVLARIVGASRSAARLGVGIAIMAVLALAVRALDALVMYRLPAGDTGGAPIVAAKLVVLITMGTQGKFLEVFAAGMLCAVVYVAVLESNRLTPRQRQLLGLVLLGSALFVLAGLIPLWSFYSPYYAPGTDIGTLGVVVPSLVGLGYGSLLLAILFGHGILRAIFEFYPFRFIGLISYSLYLWHLPFLQPKFPELTDLPLATVRLPLAFLVAYLSYQLVERPFFSRRKAISVASSLPEARRPDLLVVPSAATSGTQL